MDSINQVYESPKFSFKKTMLLIGSAGIMAFAIFLTFLLESNKSNLSLQNSRAEQTTRKTLEEMNRIHEPTPTMMPRVSPARHIVTKQDLNEAIKEIDTGSSQLDTIEKDAGSISQ